MEKQTSKKLNKKVVIAIAAIVVIGTATVLFFMNKNQSNEKKLDTSLVEMGREFYEDFYYE